MPSGDAVSQHDRPAGPAVDSAATEPSHRRFGWHRRFDFGRPVVRLRRRGDRHQPGHRFGGNGRAAAAHAGRADRNVSNPDPIVRAGPRDHAACGYQTGRAGGSGVSIDRRHRGGERQLWRESETAGGSAGCREIAIARHAGKQCHVFRNGPGLVPFSQRTSRRRSANAGGPRVRGSPPLRAAAW